MVAAKSGGVISTQADFGDLIPIFKTFDRLRDSDLYLRYADHNELEVLSNKKRLASCGDSRQFAWYLHGKSNILEYSNKMESILVITSVSLGTSIFTRKCYNPYA